MAPKMNEAAMRRKFESKFRRELVLDLWGEGKSYSAIAAEMAKVLKKPCARSAVQPIIQRFKDRPTVAAKSSGGVQPK